MLRLGDGELSAPIHKLGHTSVAEFVQESTKLFPGLELIKR